MDKFAQEKRKRRIGFFNKLKEDYGPGKILEEFSGDKSEFSELMKLLINVDDDVREKSLDLKGAIKAARSSFNRREYMTAVGYLGKFHTDLELIMRNFGRLSSAVDLKHNEFLFKDMPDEVKKYLGDITTRYTPKPKTAGLLDWWSNIKSPTGKALKAWEKRFPKFAKELKRETEKLLIRSESLHNNLLSSLKNMASFRASRRLEEYLSSVMQLTSKYREYDAAFKKYYDNYAKKFIEQQKAYDEQNKDVPKNEIGIPGYSDTEKPDNKELGIASPVIDTPKVEMSNVEPKKWPHISEDVDEPSWPGPNSPRPSSIIPSNNVEPNINSHPIPLPFRPTVPSKVSPEVVEKPVNVEVAPAFKEPFLPSPSAKNKPMVNVVPGFSNSPETYPFEKRPEAILPPPASEPRLVNIPKPPRLPSETEPPSSKADTKEFLDKIQKMSGDNPLIIANEIIKFANLISNTDKSTSDMLLKIAKNIIK